jgi:hypothetical protein
MDQKVKQHRFLKYLWLLHTPKKLTQSYLLGPGSGSDRIRNTGGSLLLELKGTKAFKKQGYKRQASVHENINNVIFVFQRNLVTTYIDT